MLLITIPYQAVTKKENHETGEGHKLSNQAGRKIKHADDQFKAYKTKK